MPTLYLMLGYPGSGKTTVSRVIHDLTGAVHLWADGERRKRFKNPTHSHQENLALYAELNQLTDDMLAAGKSVIFDTNFNFYKDRQHMRDIAAKHMADVKLIWVQTPLELAKQRATQNSHTQDTRILGDMSEADFDRIGNNLQPPRDDENYISIDGLKVGIEMRRVFEDRDDLWHNLLWWPRTLKRHGLWTWVFGYLGAIILYIVSFAHYLAKK